ncbi:MAG: leucyl aminopeptidase family protein [Succinivibrio sp.]|nr:leucyl aminopeptidase family protein [Succinivibrio sp.]
MAKFSFFSQDEVHEKLCNVVLAKGKAKPPYSEDTQMVPHEDGYTVFVSDFSLESIQKAARRMAGLGVFSLSVSLKGAKLGELAAYWFATALYDGIHDIKVAFALKKKELELISMIFETVAKFRALADTDSKVSTPKGLVDRIFGYVRETVQKERGVCTFKLLSSEDEDFSKFQGLLTVGQGSAESPCLGVIDYAPDKKSLNSAPDVALVGKGITFDSGGYNIKPGHYMDTMRTDKTAVVNLAGALILAIKMGLKRHVRLYLACSENMLSGKAMVPGDLIHYDNGLTVEITNTDAEGRLVLADALIAATRSRAKFIVDAATLTGAAKVALGRDMCAFFTRDNKIPVNFIKAFEKTGEKIWQLPFSSEYKRFLKSRRADLANSGSGEGAPGASVAAAFLESFVGKKIPWIHLDLSSAYLPSGSPFLCEGPTGATIYAIATWLAKYGD